MMKPEIRTPLPGPRAQEILERDRRVISPSYTRSYPLVAARGEGAIVEDVDGNRFLDFNAGIAVVATGHCHPKVVESIQEQATRLIHMSGTDFYYENMVKLAERLAAAAPGGVPRRIHFGFSGAEATITRPWASTAMPQRTGSAGNGCDQSTRANPDGYTLIMANPGSHAINAALGNVGSTVVFQDAKSERLTAFQSK